MDESIKKTIKKQWVKKPSANFTTQVMNRIFELNPRTYEPLVSKRGWLAVTLTVVFLVTGFFGMNRSIQSENTGRLEGVLGIKQKIGQFTLSEIDPFILNTLVWLSVTLLAVFLLIAFDYYLKQRFNQK